MTYKECLNYIHSLSRFGIRPGLERVEALLNKIQNPQDALSCIHVAGTNGKGSTSTALAYGLSGCGYTVGLYTSPFVLDFRERIQLVRNGQSQMISEEELVKIVGFLIPYAEAVGEITEFEFVTAAAFFYFAAVQADLCVIEVGLGGRFDATNVIKKPLCSVITTIGLDHTDILGSTLSEIAAEKCGIIKEKCPVVTTYLQPVEALDVIYDCCKQRNAPLNMPSERQSTLLSESLTASELEYFGKKIKIPFPGEHQRANCLTALTAAFTLRDSGAVSLHNDSFISGLEKAKIPARQELIRETPLLILDGSHNPDGIRELSKQVKKYINKEDSLLIIGMLKDKDVKSSLSLITPYFDKIYTVTPPSPRAMENRELAKIIGNATPVSVEEAASLALKNGGDTVICGSLYLAAEIRQMLTNRKEDI